MRVNANPNQLCQAEAASLEKAHVFDARPCAKADIELATHKLLSGNSIVLNNHHASMVDLLSGEWDVKMDHEKSRNQYLISCRNQRNGYSFYYPLDRFSVEDVVSDLARGAPNRIR